MPWYKNAMCGRFSLGSPPELIARIFHLAAVPELAPRYNIAPTQSVAVIRLDGEGQPTLSPMHWGLVPGWARDRSMAARMINARSETVASKPSFREPFRRRRCLVPADGFFEWRKEPDGRRQAFHFRVEENLPFAFAGLWDRWTGEDGTLESCTILTRPADAVVAPVHHRMPVILDTGQRESWLDAASDPVRLEAMLAAPPSTVLVGYPVSSLVNNARNDEARCVQPIS
ncbi:MAG: SOS response-associated peptidase [Gammaproteobacteria bacterium]|nr:SOS response-associated peptidase [Gammaproteobacteria bacterium]